MINWDNALPLFYLIVGGLEIGWSVEYFQNKQCIRGGIFMICAIACVINFAKCM